MPAAPTPYSNGSAFTIRLRQDATKKKFFDTSAVAVVLFQSQRDGRSDSRGAQRREEAGDGRHRHK